MAFKLTEKDSKNIEECKLLCAKAHAIEIFDPNKCARIFTDASDLAYGAVICQLRDDNTIKICYVNEKKFTNNEQKWHCSEKEVYAIVQTVWKYAHILKGTKIYIYTDHINIIHIFSLSAVNKFTRQKLGRWLVTLCEFNIIFVYFPGKFNTLADWISRKFECNENERNNIELPNNINGNMFNFWVKNSSKIIE